jgi:hypothetical protein
MAARLTCQGAGLGWPRDMYLGTMSVTPNILANSGYRVPRYHEPGCHDRTTVQWGARDQYLVTIDLYGPALSV